MKLTTQELEQMRSVDIGAVAAESLPDVSGMTLTMRFPERSASLDFCRLSKIHTAFASVVLA